jgi:hypothetical protein
MDMKGVDSSNIDAIGFDAFAKKLRIRFKSGETYEYDTVPQTVHNELMNANSHGSYFNKNIRDKYPTKKL